MAFSDRSAFERRLNPIASWLAGRPAPDVDLTEGNPTRVGLLQPERVALLGDRRGARYEPSAVGSLEAREAVARYYARRGVTVDPGRVVLTASSSEAYAFLFKLLCGPGDVVLAPTPSYPLLPFLTRLEAVRLSSYRLAPEEGWRIDHGDLSRKLEAGPRALIAVSPANPTGQYLHPDDRARLVSRAQADGLSLIVDEVFHDYAHGEVPASFAAEHRATSFVLGGLSKAALLPQVKLGWIVVNGRKWREARARLEVVADTYLSVSTAAQLAAPAILDGLDEVQERLRRRLAGNLRALDAAIAAAGADCPVRRRRCEGGWYVLVEVPRTRSDDDWVRHLAETESILVQPGYFYDLNDGVMVVSLLLEPGRFAEAVGRAVTRWAAG